MADQASVSGGNPGAGSPGKGKGNGTPEGRVVGGIAEFGNDIATLAELQFKLTLIDLKECVQRAMVPLGLAAVGLFLILGALPVALLGVATLVAVALKIGTGWAMLLTGGVVLVLAGVVVVVSALRLVPSFSSFRRSYEELTRNMAWIRTVLFYSGRNIPRRNR